MENEEDEPTWDGPNIRPPQQNRDSGGRSKSLNDRKHHSRHRRHQGDQSSQRHSDHGSSRHSSSRNSSEKHGFTNRPDHRSSRDYKPQRVADLRERLSGHRSDSRGNEPSRDKSSTRDKGWSKKSRERDVEQRTRKTDIIVSEGHSEKRHNKNRSERSHHRIVEKKSSSDFDKRLKRDHSKERDHKPSKVLRPESTKSSKHTEVFEIEESSEEDEEDEEEEEGDEDEESKNGSAENVGSESEESSSESGGEETEGESGEIESSTESGDETGSEHSGDTPEHHNADEEDEENSGSGEEVSSPIEKTKERSLSRSPSTNKDPSEKDDQSNHKVETPRSSGSFADNVEQENEDKKEETSTEKNDEPAEDNCDEDDSLPVYLPSVHGCRSVEEFQCLNRIEEGTYGVVYRAKDKRTNKIVALKRLKMEREKEGFPITSLREINTLLISQHPNVVTVREIVVGSNMDKIYIVMDFVEHDMKSLMETMRQRKHVFLPAEVKCLMQQLLRAIAHLHDNWILHRDLKTSNLLLSHNGILKVGDFGLAREYGSPLKPYTPVVVTLWYRAPELLLGLKEYSTHIDVWSIGCIFGEFLLMEPMFPGKGDMDQLSMIFKLLGTPNEKNYPYLKKLPVVQRTPLPDCQPSNLRNKFTKDMLTDTGLNFLKSFLNYDHTKRFSCEDALLNDYFKELPKAIDPRMFPTWPAKSEQSILSGQAKKGASPKPPSGGGAYKKINEDEEAYTGFVLNPGTSAAPAPWNLRF